EVPTGLHFTGATMLTWPGVDGASFYNTYRGTIPGRMLASRPPAGPLYDQACFEYGDANGDGALISTDAASPPVGTAFYYLVSVAGCGWSCVSNSCSRSDPLGPGAAYPPITVTVNVAGSASSPQVNQAGVSGGGSASASSNDSTVIIPLAPILSITKTHTGNF